MEDETNFDDVEGQYHSEDWTEPVKRKLGLLWDRPLKRRMWKVKNKLREVEEDTYSPRVVAIGPYHSPTITRSFIHPRAMENHMLPLLQQMPINKYEQLLGVEEEKWWYMLYLLNRTNNPREIFDKCSNAILTTVTKARRRYAERIEVDSHELAQIMLVDGCFILELFLRFSFNDFTEEDPIFHNDSIFSNILHDLVLLENQIPFFILQDLFDIFVEHFPEPRPFSITDLALRFFYPNWDLNHELIRNQCDPYLNSALHLLDLLNKFGLPTYLKKNYRDTEHGKSLGFRKCVIELLEDGIDFKRKEQSPFWDISFDRNGFIAIPPLHIDETTESLFRNLIDFQQGGNPGSTMKASESPLLGASTQHIASYAILMKSLIHSRADLKLLQQRGIITYQVGTEKALNFFKNISEEVVIKDFYFDELCEKVNEYRVSSLNLLKKMPIWKIRWQAYIATTKKKWLKYMGDLKAEYFSNPWHVMSVIAALVLLILTGLQTYYTVRPYLHLP